MRPLGQKRETLYAYIDESGQDTEGRFFVVGVLVIGETRATIQKQLEEIEKISGKGNSKWHKAKSNSRKKYIEAVVRLSELHSSLFYEIFHDDKKYVQLIGYATAHAILKKAKPSYRVSIFVDGFTQTELERLIPIFKDFQIRKRKLRGVRREENNAFIRLVDALCGLVRDASDDNQWSKDMLKRLQKKNLVTVLLP